MGSQPVDDDSDAYGSDDFEDLDDDDEGEEETQNDKAEADQAVEPEAPESSLPSPATSKQSSVVEQVRLNRVPFLHTLEIFRILLEKL